MTDKHYAIFLKYCQGETIHYSLFTGEIIIVIAQNNLQIFARIMLVISLTNLWKMNVQ